MDLKQANVLITGGSDGIGFGLASRFLQAGSTVLVTGRNEDKLVKASQALPGLKTLINDISDPLQREVLANHIRQSMSRLNIIINNAGIQRRIPLARDNAQWTERQNEIDILLAGPIHLNHLLIPLLLNNAQPALIVNVTSIGAYIPQAFAPVYSACKAALHSYTITLRHALAGTSCRVVELIPPAIQTSLAGPDSNHGASLDNFCDKVFPELIGTNKSEIGFESSENLIPQLSGQPVSEIFEARAARAGVDSYLNLS
ncbi:uncharacterized oxidoreductase [Dyadobacter sp. SG02]|uniref:SDR family NAD(P)-dependent oxidoreductase n=1 Tax=Dyadobacter sp. SG02 TaxID=1855291 RepID=UPI0008CBDA4D|nr:SDR family NAD(P)-dependent oxidoreductase [Dyadobacter sp. SG02]SEJ75515.1 uncharacterized oxidoreductase [Dyadobacter sp. SG02]